MSYFSQIRRIPSVRSLIRDLSERLMRFQAAQNRVDDANDLIEILRVRYHKIKFDSSIKSSFIQSANKSFYLPFEPDGDHLRLWFRACGWMGDFSAIDYSGYKNQIHVPAVSGVVEGPEGGDRIALFLNGTSDYIDVLSSDNIAISTLTTGFTLTAWVYPLGIDQHNGKNRVIASYIEDNAGMNGYVLELIPDGSIKFTVVKDGNNSTVIMNNAITTTIPNDEDPNQFTEVGFSKWYLVIAKFVMGVPNNVYLYVNNVPLSSLILAATANFDYRNFLSSNFATIGDQTQATLPTDPTHNFHIGNRGGNTDSLFYGYITDVRLYCDLLFTDVQAGNFWKNKLTITDVDYGEVAVLGRWFLRGTVSFSPDSFTDQSFTTPQGIHGNDSVVFRMLTLEYQITPVPTTTGRGLKVLYNIVNDPTTEPPIIEPPVIEPPVQQTPVERDLLYSVITGDVTTYRPLTLILSHEIIETITDPDPLNQNGKQAWGSKTTGEEVSDICETIDMTYPSGLDIEAYWSNSDSACIIPNLPFSDSTPTNTVSNRKGGRVLPNSKVWLVYWGSNWQTRTAVPTAEELTHRIRDLLLGTDKAYFNKCSQYGVTNAPVWGDAVFNTTFSIPSGDIKESDCKAMLIDCFNKGILSTPSEINQDIYNIMVPIGKKIIHDGGTTNPGGFHNEFVATIGTESGGLDKLGVKMIYPTNSAVEAFYMNWSNLDKDPRFDFQTDSSQYSRNNDNESWNTRDTGVRMDIFVKGVRLNDTAKGQMDSYDFSDLVAEGSWRDRSTDWHNIECSAYFRLKDTDTFWGFVTRSVQHQPDQHSGCGGSSYHGNIDVNGVLDFKKEQWHVDYVQGGKYTKDVGVGSIKDKWIGMKVVVYDKIMNGKLGVIEEIWLDRNNNNNWSKEFTIIDQSDIGTTMNHCGNVPKSQAIIWGSPSTLIKSNIHNGGSIDFKKVSVREIIPPT